MAIFKSPIDKLWENYNKLSDEDKVGIKAKLMDIDKSEDEREVDKIEENKAENPEAKDEKAEEVREESDEIGKEVDETAKAEEGAENTEEPTEDKTEEPEAIAPVLPDYEAKFHEYDEMFAALNAKIEAFAKKPIEEERKPFGKSEGTADFHAPAKKETSDEMLKRLFG